MSTNLDSYFKIGLIIKPHGLKGEVTITLDDETLVDLSALESVFVMERDKSLVPYFIESVSGTEKKAFVKFEDVNGPEEAKKISKTAIYLPKSLRPKSGKGEFYDDEIIGFEVTDSQFGRLGLVTEIIITGSNKLISVDSNGKEVLIPVNSPLIISINKRNKTISVSLPDGFLDI